MTKVPRAHRLAYVKHTPQEIAAYLKEHYFSSEAGWMNLFGASWEDAHAKLEHFPDNSKDYEIFRAIGGTLLPHLPFLHCASCFSFTTALCNLGRTSATFWVCERCLDDAKAQFPKDTSK